MSADCIRFDRERNAFGFDNQIHRGSTRDLRIDGGVLYIDEPEGGDVMKPISVDFLGRIISKALVGSINRIQFDTVSVTVNYLVEMLRFTGKNGWFYDCLSDTADHSFDGNSPTPGGSYNEARQLMAEAREHDDYARLARVANQYGEAEAGEERARDCRKRARQLRSRA